MRLLKISKNSNESDILKEGFSDNFASPLQIRANLEEVCKKNTRLIAAIDERPATYGNMFLEVGKGSSIIIDILMPKHGNGLLISSKNIKIDFTFEGIGYYFGAKFIEMTNGSFPAIKIAFPSIIKKIQRRFAFRVSPSIDNPVNVELIGGVAEAVSDISEGGLSFYTRFTEEEMRVGMILDRII